jgi:hypothetical protein
LSRNAADLYIKLAGSVAVPSTPIESGDYNLQIDDVVNALNDVAMLSGSKNMTGLQTLFGQGTAALHGATVGQVQSTIVAHATVVGGTADAIVLTFAPVFTANTAKTFVRWTSAGANTITAPTVKLDTALGALTIKKGAGAALAVGDTGASGYICYGVYNGTDFILLNPAVTATAPALASTTEVLTGTDAAKTATPDAIAALWEQGGDVASAGTISLGEGGYFNITGTTTITDIDLGTDKAGRRAWLKFAGILTLTHNATTLILPTGANITTAAGDTAEVISEGSDVVRVVSYQRASGAPLAGGGLTLGTPQNTTSGTSIDFTGIPAGTKRITIMYNEVSMTDNIDWLIQIGDSGGIETTGYAGSGAELDATPDTNNSSTGFVVGTTLSLVASFSGIVTLVLFNSSTNLWVMSGVLASTTTNSIQLGAGAKALSGTLDRVRLTGDGTATFDNGSVNIMYE